jgi:hypothetical protein
LEKTLGEIPGASVLTGTARKVKGLHELGQAGRQVSGAQKLPLNSTSGSRIAAERAALADYIRRSAALLPAAQDNRYARESVLGP